ncbi:hypothetical protein [Candidatus Parabeggiatoa sp. HSG14]|uniref:hypothetical protein n=1 Tax=Candidatus Parabeggiatoa sp. HSG14 TaxID=3055593 RepID=UPI0025A8AEE7|nr:hypothetical protein [Thiotrichales bacterium HSG14]
MKRISAAKAFGSSQADASISQQDASSDFDASDDLSLDGLGEETVESSAKAKKAEKTSFAKHAPPPTPQPDSSDGKSSLFGLQFGHARARMIDDGPSSWNDFAEQQKKERSRTRLIEEQSPLGSLVTSEELQLEKEPIKVRETGFWWWRRIVVPPNAYVVHTRMGRDTPVTTGLGKSFRYNPNTDAYLVVPAAMQTIGIVARCITKEKQGINILAYLQWQMHDFSIAYQKLDFSDSRDPLGIVNAQLSEQAEAAIKDKIATMSVEEVLTDKAPIIEELTKRLEAVTEGRNHEAGGAHEGLGIKIVTVQIREAFVSSKRLWQDLQAPFRHQQEKAARISQLTMQNELHKKELENRQLKETREAETNVVIERVRETKQTEALNLNLAEESIRFTKKQEVEQQKIQLEEQTTLTRQASMLKIQVKEQEATQQKIQLEQKTALTEQASEQQLQAEQARLDYESQLEQLQRVHTKTLEQAKLDNEANSNQKTLQTEQALHIVTEENRLNTAKMEAEQLRLEQNAKLKKQSAELKLLVQEQENLLEAKMQEACIARQQQSHLADLELEEASNQVKMALREKEMGLARLEQEARNLTNGSDLLRRLIDKSADIAAEMPEIQELKVLQTGGGNGDITFDAFSAFVAKMLAVAESLGISLNEPKTVSQTKKKRH